MMVCKKLPAGWVHATLADFGVWSSGGTPNKKKPEYHNGDIPWVTTSNLEDGPIRQVQNGITKAGLENSSAKLFPEGTLLMAMYGATIGKLGILKIKAATNQACAALLPSEANRDCIQYVYFYLLSKREDFKKAGKGGAQPNISQTVVKQTSIPVPPLNEQCRIVEKIETLFARLDKGEEALREMQRQLFTYRQSVLKAAVTGQLTANWRAQNAHRLEHGRELLERILQTRRETWEGRGKYKAPVAPDTSDLPDIPEGWVWASVDQLLRTNLSNGRSVPSANDGFPVLRLTSLKDGRIDIRERKIGAWNVESARPFLIERGDVLISRGNGSKHLVGRGGLVKEEPDSVAYPDTMIRISIILKFLWPEWFLLLWNSPFMRQQIEKAAKTTAGIYKINQTDIRYFKVPLPPIREQEEVAAQVGAMFDKISILETLCETELTRSSALRQSILKDAFTGRLVSQNPSNEPAEKLLARIKENRLAPTRKTRRSAVA